MRLKRVLKWIGIVIGGLIGLLLVAGAVLYLIGSSRLNKKYAVAVEPVSIPADAASVERGKHLADAVFLCTDCHAGNMGGQLYFEVPGMLSIPTPNLTGGSLTDEDFARAVRHGVGPDGRALFIMPANTFHGISDADLGAVIAYIRSLPAVDNPLPERSVALFGRLMMGAGMFPPFAADRIDHAAEPGLAPAVEVSAAYGQYLTRTCTECHGADLNGAPFGPPGQEVPTPNLTRGGELAAWSEADFIRALRTGVTPAGRTMNEDMPWKWFGQMTDDELQAVWMYLRSLPALAQGG